MPAPPSSMFSMLLQYTLYVNVKKLLITAVQCIRKLWISRGGTQIKIHICC